MTQERGLIFYDPKSPMTTIAWKIKDFFFFPHEQKNYRITSPKFTLLNAKWYLSVCSFGNIHSTMHTDLWLSVYSPNICNVTYKFGIRGTDGTDLMISEGLYEFGKDLDSVIFTSVPHLFCCNRELYAPDDELTVFFTLQQTRGATKAPRVDDFGLRSDKLDEYFKKCDSGENKSIILSVEDFLIQSYESDENSEECDDTETKSCSSSAEDSGSRSDELDEHSKECDGTENKSCTLPGVKRLVQDVKGLFLNELDTDVILKVGEQEFRVHRAILRARSPVFQAMLEHDMNKRCSGIAEIPLCDSGAFRDFLIYLYSGKVDELSSANVLNLYKTADMYDVADLKTECIDFMMSNMCVDTFCDVVELALKHDESEILKEATEFFAKNLETITISVDWQNFLKLNTVAGNEMYIKALKYHGVLKGKTNDANNTNTSLSSLKNVCCVKMTPI